jgi:TonB-dependent receptor
LSLEWRPFSGLETYFDAVIGEKNNKLLRTDINVAVRNNALIPMGQTFDSTTCTIGCVVTGGTYANAQAFLEYRQWIEKTKFWSANPGFDWRLNDEMSVDGQLSATRSNFSRETPTLLITTNTATPSTISYVNDGSLPTYTSSLNLNDPANFGWYAGNNLIAFYEGRMVDTKGGRVNFKWTPNDNLTVKTGAAYDTIARRIVSFNDGSAWANAARAAVPTANVKNYLVQDAKGYVNLNWDSFRSISGYDTVAANNTETSGGTNAGTTPGFFEERISAAYVQATGQTKLLGNKLRYDAGVRFTSTDQIIGTKSGSGATLAESRQKTNYNNTLPNASFAYNILNDVVGRGSVSQSITRADPTQLRVLSLAFSDPAASAGNLTNPDLKPYTSTNLDLGVEWYTGKGGYLAAAYFAKDIKNFTSSVNTTVPFSALAQYGVTYATLTTQQQTAIDNRGGPANTTVVLTQQQNTTDLLHIRGMELTWAQPLDVVLPVKGFGFTSNYTRVKQDGGPSGFIATGVAPWTANFTAYYEDGRATVRVSHTMSKGSQLTTSPQNGLNTTAAQLYSNDYKQTDLSTRLEIGDWVGWKPGVSLSFDVWNLGKTVQRQYFQQTNAAYQAYDPGRSYFAGVRAKF